MRKSTTAVSVLISLSISIAALFGLVLIPAVAALPTGGEIRHGTGTIADPTDGLLTITQDSQKMVIDWLTFSIGEHNTVRFHQVAGPDAVALNRVLGGDLSEIYGTLSADGQLFLLNPQGILFGAGTRVDVAGLVATSLALRDEDFVIGNYEFSNPGSKADGMGAVVNQGEIVAGRGPENSGGYVALLAPRVQNDGTITAYLGTVALGAGGSAVLELVGGGLLSLVIDEEVVGAFLENRGEITADGGVVRLEAQSHEALLNTVLNQEGIVRARSVESQEGRIVLSGGPTGVVEVSGTLDVSRPEMSESGRSESAHTVDVGGSIDVSGEHIALMGDAVIDASGSGGGGTVRIGGGYQGQQSDIDHSQRTYIGKDVRIDASATMRGEGGTVIVWADDLTYFDGFIAARGGELGGDGGLVETSGGFLSAGGLVDVTAGQGKSGTWLLDPFDIVISDAAGDFDVIESPIGVWTSEDHSAVVRASSIESALEAGNNVTVKTGQSAGSSENGNITVAAPITWSTDSVLTLDAHGNIVVNAPITASTGGLTLAPGIGGLVSATAAVDVGLFTLQNGTWRQIGPDLPAFTATDFRLHPESTFIRVLGGDGSGADPYQVFDVYGLQGVGSFGMSGLDYVLVADIDARGTQMWREGKGFVHIGPATDFSDPADWFTGNFDGQGHVIRGLYINDPDLNSAGLFGAIDSGSVVRRVGLEEVRITGLFAVGGLAGWNNGTIQESYTSGKVDGLNYIGGLVGRNEGEITHSYSISDVEGYHYVGGLVGTNSEYTFSASISHSYSGGKVYGRSSNIGGLIGFSRDGAVTESYWNTETSGQSTSGGGGGAIGLTTGQMMHLVERSDNTWDVDGVWALIPGVSYPYLTWQFGGQEPTVIWGMVEGDEGGTGVSAVLDGLRLGSVYTGANGFYYIAVDPHVTGSVLVWLDGNEPFGGGSVTALAPAQPADVNAHATGLDITSDTLAVHADGSDTWSGVLETLLERAVGDLSAAEDGVPYEVDDDQLQLQAGLGLKLLAGGDFTVDGRVELAESMAMFVGGSLILVADGRIVSNADGDAIILVVGDRFINLSDTSNAISATNSNGRWLIVSNTPVGGDRGRLVHDFRYYGMSHGDDWSELPGGSGFLYALTPEVTVVLQGTVEKEYDGNDDADLSEVTYVVLSEDIPGEYARLVNANLPTRGAYSDRYAGQTKQVIADLTGLTPEVMDGDVQILGLSFGSDQATGNIGVINPALLRVIADNAARRFGGPDPTFSVTYIGFVGGERPEDLDGQLVFATDAGILAPPGEYVLTPGGLESDNYNIEFVDGILTVTPGVPGQMIPPKFDEAYRAAKVNYYRTVPGNDVDSESEVVIVKDIDTGESDD